MTLFYVCFVSTCTMVSRKVVFGESFETNGLNERSVVWRAISGNTFSYLAPLVRDFLPFTRISFPPFSRTRSSSIPLPFPRTKSISSNDDNNNNNNNAPLFHQGRYFSIE